MRTKGFTIAGSIDEVFAVLEALGELRIFKKYPIVEVMTRMIEKKGGKSNEENEHEQN